MLEEALKYWEKGWSIIPINKDKTPAISSWTKYQTQLPTRSEVIQWWTQNPNANIAVICGISNLIVVDIDYGHGSETNQPDIKGLELPPTLVSKTGSGGFHYIYKKRPGLMGKKTGYRNLVDIQSENAYIILPPSVHTCGKAYEWVMGEDEPIADAPSWLESSEKLEEKTDWSKFLQETKGQGVRNMSATQLAGKILYEMSPNLWDTLGLITFRAWNKEANNPPLPDKELLGVWNSIKKKHLKDNGKEIIERSEVEEDETHNDDEKSIIKVFLKNKTEGTYRLAQHIVRKYNIITVGEKERELFVYQEGYYCPAENNIIFPEIQKILSHHVNKTAKLETLHKIADMTSYSRDVFTSADINLIPLKNGVYNTKTKELLPHDPKYRFTAQFPVIYDSGATCPRTEAFFDQILTPEQRMTVEEWIGYYFMRNYMFKKAMIFVGEGDTGKTTLLEVITYLLGRENLSSISLQKMSSDKFAAAHLYGKHGNLVDELSARDITDTGTFKVATGGGSITGEYKFGNQFSFVNYSKFTFACNQIPDVSSDANDSAYFNRWIITRFENTITKKIPNFIATLTNEGERSGLFNLAMKGLERLMEQGRFSYNNNAEQTKTEMLRSGSSLAMFASEKLERLDDNEVTKEDLYEAYAAFCKEKNVSTQTKDMVGKKLTDYAPFVSDGLISILNKRGKPDRVRGWRGVKIKGTNVGVPVGEDPDFKAFDKVGKIAEPENEIKAPDNF
jgi:P4 family phage/plasmid primase-like protien